MARLVPIEDDAEVEARILERLRGTARMLVSEEEFLRPTTDLGGWDVTGAER